MSFTAFPLDTLGLPAATVQLCTRANYVNAQDILLAAPSDISRKLKLRLSDTQQLIKDISTAIAPRASTVGSLVGGMSESGGLGKRKRASLDRQEEGWIRTGDEGLDMLLGGGLKVGCITEIVGESAAGKSHLTLHLSLAAQLPSLTSTPGGAIILTSERELSTTRLTQLAEIMRRRHGVNTFMKRDSLSDGVLTRRVGDVEELDLALSYWVPALLERGRGKGKGKGKGRSGLMGFGSDSAEEEQEGREGTPIRPETSTKGPMPKSTDKSRGVNGMKAAPAHLRSAPSSPTPIRLLVLDSLTALLRGADTSYSSSSAGLTARSRHLCVVADKLKVLAMEYDLAVVVINQVSDVFDRKSYSNKPATVAEDDETGDTSASGPGTSTPRHSSQAGPSHLRPSQLPGHASSSQSLTYSQAWYASGPDPPMLYSTQSKWFSGQSSAKTKEAALGVVWANAVNTRIMLSRTGRRRAIRDADLGLVGPMGMGNREIEEGGEVGWEEETPGQESEPKTLIRRAHVVFSPFAPSGTVDFVIRSTGVHALKDTYALDEGGASILGRARRRTRAREEDREEEEEEEVPIGGEMGDDDLFGRMDGLGEVPDEWWAGNVDGAGEVEVELGEVDKEAEIAQ